jgi:hypothetical protein
MQDAADSADSQYGPEVEAARKGADRHRLSDGEDPRTDSLRVARHWVDAYRQLVELEQGLFDDLASRIPDMNRDAIREAEQTNVPLIASQIERFRFRLEFWLQRKRDLEKRSARSQ